MNRTSKRYRLICYWATMSGAVLLSTLVSLMIPSAGHAIMLEGFGVKGAAVRVFNDFQFEGEELLETENIWSWSAGGFLQWKKERRSTFHVLTEAWWVRKGYKGARQFDDGTEPVSVQLNADYLSIPILLRPTFHEDKLTTYALFGISGEILLSSDDTVVYDDFRSFVIAGNVGIGFEYELGRRLRALLEFRFNSDFMNNYNAPEGSPLSSAIHRNLMIVGGARF